MHAEVFQYLREQGFLDDARYAATYARSKLRLKKWGKMKIVQGLKLKGLKEPHITNALKGLDWDEYYSTIRTLLQQKGRLLKDPEGYVRQQRLVKFVVGKGFEPHLVWEVLKEDAQ